MPHPIQRTSTSTGTGNFTFVEDVSDILQVNDIFESYIELQPDADQFEFSNNSVYLGGGVFQRGDILSSSNDDGSTVDFAEGTKAVNINLTPTEIVRNTTGVTISNGNIAVTNVVTTTITAGTITANTITANTVKFGTHTVIAAEVITGYITITDSAGTVRKLAVVS